MGYRRGRVNGRVGDIDNFGVPWGKINPFSGKETAVHSFPYKPESDDPGN